MEERYDLNRAEKTFTLRKALDPLDDNSSLPVRAGQQVWAQIHIQEIAEDSGRNGIFETGCITWEASIAASLYFSSNPLLLQGDLIELGCGVGYGGILTAMGPILTEKYSPLQSITFTDYNLDVLKCCKQNIHRAFAAFPERDLLPLVNVSILDWNDFNPNFNCYQRYQTVLAYDCAYRYSDVNAFGRAVKGLLHEDDSSRIHLFAPYNRSVMYEVMRYLRDDLNMHVVSDTIDMDRYHLRPGDTCSSWKDATISDCAVAAKCNSKFLHVTASFSQAKGSSMPLFDID